MRTGKYDTIDLSNELPREEKRMGNGVLLNVIIILVVMLVSSIFWLSFPFYSDDLPPTSEWSKPSPLPRL